MKGTNPTQPCQNTRPRHWPAFSPWPSLARVILCDAPHLSDNYSELTLSIESSQVELMQLPIRGSSSMAVRAMRGANLIYKGADRFAYLDLLNQLTCVRSDSKGKAADVTVEPCGNKADVPAAKFCDN